MTLSTPLRMMGAPGSPYTRKMRALLRYRRITYEFVQHRSAEAAALPTPRVSLLPTFYFEDEQGELQPATDSTPLIRRFAVDTCRIVRHSCLHECRATC